MKGWIVLIDGKNEHGGPMEDVSGRFVAAGRHLKAQDFVRMNRTHFYRANRESTSELGGSAPLSLNVEVHGLANG